MTELKEGQKAPAFKGKDQNGNTVSLADFKGQKVVLYFYPEDDTGIFLCLDLPLCHTHCNNIRQYLRASVLLSSLPNHW